MSRQSGERAARRAAAEVVGSCHERELGKLLEHVREALVRCDAGAIDAFEVDRVIHRAAGEVPDFFGGVIHLLQPLVDPSTSARKA
jgi:hypothetical protein